MRKTKINHRPKSLIDFCLGFGIGIALWGLTLLILLILN